MYYTQQLFQGQRERILRVVDLDDDSQQTKGFIHIFDEQRPFNFDYAKEMTQGTLTPEQFNPDDESDNTFSINFMPLIAEDDEISDGLLEEWAALVGREYALIPQVHLNMFQQGLKPEIEAIEKESYEERLMTLITRVLGSSIIGFDQREVTLFPSHLVQEKAQQNDNGGTQIILPD